MKKAVLILGFVTSGFHIAHAQTAQDGILFSQDDVTGTARFNAMGGAFSSLGGDWTSVFQNPAGLGVYRTSEFSISPALHVNMTNSDYAGTSSLDGKTNFNFGNLAFVGTQSLREQGKWRSSAFGVGLSRSATYHKNYAASGENIATSLLDDYVTVMNENNHSWEDLNNGNLYPFDVQLAWYNFLIDTLPGATGFIDTIGSAATNQSLASEASGAKRETYFSFGGNYDDRLYLGAGVNISRIIFRRETLFSEAVPSPEEPYGLSEYSFSNTEVYSGRGISLNAGIIYRPVESLRLGLSAQTPTWYSIDYDFSSSMTASYINGDFYETLSPEGNFDFRLTTPFKSTVGIAYVIGKLGLVSADVEFIDYSMIRYRNLAGERTGRAFLNQLNDELANGLKPTLNYRVGGEYRITSLYSARAGFAYYSNPYQKHIDNDGSFQLFSLGGGYRDQLYSVDVAYQYKLSSDRSYPYDPAISTPVDVASTDHRITLTFGFRF